MFKLLFMKQAQHFKLFASCIPIKGALESLIMDIENGQLFPIPNILLKVLKRNNHRTVAELKSYFKNNLNEGIDSYFTMFAENNLGFFTSDPASFPDIERTWKSPLQILNAVIEYANTSSYSLEDCLQQLNSLGCEAIQIRILGKIESRDFLEKLVSIQQSRIKYVEVFIDYINGLEESQLKEIRDFDSRICKIIMYSSPFNKQLESKQSYYKDIFYYVEKNINEPCNETFSYEHFAVNVNTYTESKLHNIGLNRKISIDQNGEIKNYLSHAKTFGNIKHLALEEIIKSNAFQAKWFIHNDLIEKCRDCQFRYVCVSNSDLIKENGNYIKTSPCNFDPYTNTWN